MKRVYIGIGHGGADPGACANGLRESDLNLDMGFLVQGELLRSGVEVRMSRTDDTAFPTAAKVADANSWGADAVIDLHHNAGGGAGFEIYRSQNADGSPELAGAINREMEAAGRRSRGVKTHVQNGADYFGIIRQTDAPAVLVEYGFLDNIEDVPLVVDLLHRRDWARATARGVLAFLGMGYAEQERGTRGLTPICGAACATAVQLDAYLTGINPEAPLYGELYISEGAAEGIRGDIAFAQSCLETGNWRFGGDVLARQNNFCGLGATGGGEPGNSFATPQEGVRAQIQHLKAYASAGELVNACVDPRFKYVGRGSAPYVEWLGIPDNPAGVGWAGGAGYGGKILAILEAILATEAEEETAADRGTVTVEQLRALGFSNIALESPAAMQ